MPQSALFPMVRVESELTKTPPPNWMLASLSWMMHPWQFTLPPFTAAMAPPLREWEFPQSRQSIRVASGSPAGPPNALRAPPA